MPLREGTQSPHLPNVADVLAAPTPAKPLSGWATTRWGLFALLAWLAAEGGVLVTFLVRRLTLNPGVPLDADAIGHDAFLISLAAITAAAAQTAVVVVAIRHSSWPVANYLCLGRRPRVKELVFWLICLAVILAASDLLSRIIGHELVPPFMVKVYRSADDASTIALLLLAALVTAPIGEEILFRGFVFRGWAASPLGVSGTVLLTSALWAMIHLQYDWFGIFQVFCLGLLFGVVRWRSGSTLLTILMHSACNLVAVIETAMLVR